MDSRENASFSKSNQTTRFAAIAVAIELLDIDPFAAFLKLPLPTRQLPGPAIQR